MENVHASFLSPPSAPTNWKQVVVKALLGIMLGFLLFSQASSCVEEKEHGLHDWLDDDDKLSITHNK